MANLDKIKEVQRLKYERHPDKYREAARQWAKDNPLKQKAKEDRRRALKVGAEGFYTEEEIIALHVEQNNCCYHCGVSFDEKQMHIDHWIPLSRGGSNWISNIKLLCQSCNNNKYNKLPCEWDQKYDE
jgi:5-methylcytosine-specific restriction endonuclease McrA